MKYKIAGVKWIEDNVLDADEAGCEAAGYPGGEAIASRVECVRQVMEGEWDEGDLDAKKYADAVRAHLSQMTVSK